jgi:hypothetical protein
MMKPLLLLIALTLLHTGQDVKVATWSAGVPDTDGYESLSFWIKDNHRAYIRYAHGKESEDTELRWLGPDSLDGRKGFRASFPAPDHRHFSIIPDSFSLQVLDRRDKIYRKTFQWENENRSGDSTVTCPICAQSELEAADWLRKYFMR